MAALRVLSRNVPYLRQQFSALLGNTSPTVKFICIAVIIGYFLSFSEDAINALSVTPGYFLPPSFRIWTAFTFCFLEVHLWEIIVDIVTVGLCGKLIEPLWGQLEMMLFFAVTNMGVAFITTVYYLVLYAFTSDPDDLYTIHIHGLAGYIAAVSVAVKQIMPDHLLVKTSLGRMTNRSIPLTVFLLALCFWGFGLLEGTYPCMWASGTMLSWIYLRFWQRHSNGSRGDVAENFSFDNFFPTVLQPLLRVAFSPIYTCFVKMGMCPASQKRVHLALSSRGVTISMPGVEPQDMERRRQIALKALSERLSKSGDQTRQKGVHSATVNMDVLRKLPPHVVPQFQNPKPETLLQSSTSPGSQAAATSQSGTQEALLVDIEGPSAEENSGKKS